MINFHISDFSVSLHFMGRIHLVLQMTRKGSGFCIYCSGRNCFSWFGYLVDNMSTLWRCWLICLCTCWSQVFRASLWRISFSYHGNNLTNIEVVVLSYVKSLDYIWNSTHHTIKVALKKKNLTSLLKKMYKIGLTIILSLAKWRHNTGTIAESGTPKRSRITRNT